MLCEGEKLTTDRLFQMVSQGDWQISNRARTKLKLPHEFNGLLLAEAIQKVMERYPPTDAYLNQLGEITLYRDTSFTEQIKREKGGGVRYRSQLSPFVHLKKVSITKASD